MYFLFYLKRISMESKSTSKWQNGKEIHLFMQININKNCSHSLSSKIVFSFNSFFHFVFLGMNKKHFTWYLEYFIST